ncbi:MAG: hypothetical protein B1H40_03005 [Candidatus Latescibacteria bacterium 4484_181]|nr:MAG: hypothetical protein B1H40_03005 [Candidatus Latescibacteria bacterium 4484_181]RKY69702.1 MAG: hypothetical protein DRQ02_00010 [Candidatus Latescibacterota bacterium]RKY70899.1 MAG: hypothetical protein DRQ24_08405 [Candidatus Latescibacterota bacterium]
MRSILILSNQPEKLARLKRILPTDYSIFTASVQEGPEFLRTSPIDVVIADVLNTKDLLVLQEIRGLQAQCVILCLVPEKEVVWEEDPWEISDFVLREPSSGREIRAILGRALEKRNMLEQLNILQNRHCSAPISGPLASSSTPAWEQLIKGVAKALSASFDLDRLLDLFLDTVVEMLHSSKVSILTLDAQYKEYRIRTYRGVSPVLVSRVRLKADEGLPLWLAQEGRIIRKQEAESKASDPLFLQIDRDLRALQAIAGIPLIARGSLIGILALGYTITGLSYTDEELETLFTLASHIAMAAQDIQLYHQTQYQKSYIEEILARMSSGVINIDENERVIIFNQRAEEILQRKTSEVLNQDLRCLPSPLGDMLFETLRTGKAYHKVEVELMPQRQPLQVSTYQLRGPGNAMGSVMVFDDLSTQKQLEQERLRSERLGVLNQIVGWVAHEIKNPLVSVQTFTELLPERYDDSEFRGQYCSVVAQEVRNLNELVEKLLILVEGEKYQYESVQVTDLLAECISDLKEKESYKTTNIAFDCQDGIPTITCDKKQLKRAFSYTLEYLVKSTPPEGKVSVFVSSRRGEGKTPQVDIRMSTTGLELPPEKLMYMFDPFHRNSVSDLGLCATRRIVEEHGGEVTAERNKRHKGTNFLIHLPVKNGAAVADSR